MKKKRLGIVSYLNAKPLIYGLDDYKSVKETPSNLADLYRKREIDCALLPVYELLGITEKTFVIDGIAIASREEAGSVLCFLNTDINNIKTVGLDKSSLSSVHLLKLIFKLYFGISCSYEILESKELLENSKDFDAYLLIGDNAIYHREKKHNFFDLGAIWYKWTGYPFVFAVWAVYEQDIELKERLLKSKKEGIKHIDNIIDKIDFYNKGFLLKYYKNYLSFELSDESKESIKAYGNLLYKEGFYKKLQEPLYY